jgi:hypothetical protein
MIRSNPRPARSVALSFLGGLWGFGSLIFIGITFIKISSNPIYIIPLVVGMLSLAMTIGLLQRYRVAYHAVVVLTLLSIIPAIRTSSWPLLLPFFILIPRSYQDFYGTRQRFVPDMAHQSPQHHYENGMHYKQRGMWYMATREWEAAVRSQSDNAQYHQALGLGYAQLKQFERAMLEFQKALSIQPGNARIRESIQAIESYVHNQKSL